MNGVWETLKGLFVDNTEGKSDIPEVPLLGYRGDLQFFQDAFQNAVDFNRRKFHLGADGKEVTVLYVKHLADYTKVADEVIMPLASFTAMAANAKVKSHPRLAEEMLSAAETQEIYDLKQAEELLLDGWSVILIEDIDFLIAVNTRANPGRLVTTAEIETTILGPKQAFVETLSTNLALLRQRIRTSSFKVEEFSLGTKAPVKVLLTYIEGVAPDGMVREVRERLSLVDVDELADSSYIESLIGISPFSPFPQALYTERPDRVSGNMLEGRVAILVDGSPEALVLPMGFSDLFQSPGDYYGRITSAVVVRLLRVVAFFFATTLPAIYVALIAFSYEVLPTDLTIKVATFRTGIPFPPAVETFMMILIVDILQEGVIRLPSKVGQTVGVVGGFVLGQAIIQAGIVSPLLLIAVAISLIGSFAMPDYRVIGLVRILRYVLLLGASILSGVGIVAVWMAIIIHMCSIEILGVPYLRPVAPLRLRSLQDFIYRRPYRTQSPLKSRRSKASGGENA